MPASHLTDLPTDAVSIIVSFLPMKDVRNFRQACRWADHETFHDFAARGYERVGIRGSRESVRRFARVVQESPRLAAFVQWFHVDFLSLDAVELAQACRAEREWPALARLHGREPTVSRLVAALPNLESLVITGLTSAAFAWHWQPRDFLADRNLQENTRWSGLTALSLSQLL
ncbi:hypothetical protein B0A55_08175 [Friedmanniomyces simplex]|uniref:F-box domain-containing protein n=1 Tax=Friedmanniomyces simplex TaxID=329884 RepID=A0A4U0WZ24_9PEZI|nr:hypothetical protein B0A55_08175 [Friedmanniomyces simplex]